MQSGVAIDEDLRWVPAAPVSATRRAGFGNGGGKGAEPGVARGPLEWSGRPRRSGAGGCVRVLIVLRLSNLSTKAVLDACGRGELTPNLTQALLEKQDWD